VSHNHERSLIEEDRPLPALRPEQDADGYIYDFFKFLVQLSLLTLAGVFAVSQTEGAAAEIGKADILAIMGAVTAGGIAAFMGVSAVVRAKSAGLPVKEKAALYAKLAPALYALGVGGFLAMFVDVLM